MGAVPKDEAAATSSSIVLMSEPSNPRRRPLASTATDTKEVTSAKSKRPMKFR